MFIIIKRCIFFLSIYSFSSGIYGSLPEESPSDSPSPLAKIFPVGQGNCVAVKYHGKVILIDMGSTENTFQHFYKQRSQQGGGFRIIQENKETPPLRLPSNISLSSHGLPLSSVGGASSSRSSTPSSEESTHKELRKRSKSTEITWTNTISSIKNFLLKDDVKKVVFVGSHSAHYPSVLKKS